MLKRPTDRTSRIRGAIYSISPGADGTLWLATTEGRGHMKGVDTRRNTPGGPRLLDIRGPGGFSVISRHGHTFSIAMVCRSLSRRSFVHRAGLAAAGLMLPRPSWAETTNRAEFQRRKFRLNYAPHFGMFREHAGPGLGPQLEFMAAEGFTALEDNGMRGRPVAEQEVIGKTLARLNMKMGVFVAHTINWNEPTLTTSDAAARETFLKEIQESVEIAKRVNAKWMTVVPATSTAGLT